MALGKVNHQSICLPIYYKLSSMYVETPHPNRPHRLVFFYSLEQMWNYYRGIQVFSISFFIPLPTQYLLHFSLHPVIQPGRLPRSTPLHKDG